MSIGSNKPEDWIDYRWRPAIAWLYFSICAFDFIIAPILWVAIQVLYHQPITPWVPITLQGAGLIHMALGGIVGVTSWSRTQEKVTSMNNGMNGGMFPGPSLNIGVAQTDTVTSTPVSNSAPVDIPAPKLRHH